MIVEQIYTGCLAQGAYYLESDGEAAVIDPLRETKPYLDRASKSGAKIKYVFETHFHADFVSGHLDLSKQTGAPIVYGPNAKPGFEAHIARDGEEFRIGKFTLRAIHTPGHTLESTCYLLIDEQGRQRYLFTGDTLFIGDVGRPDLAQKVGSVTIEDLAGMLYDSLDQKIKVLDDEVIVYPAHGAGSACGKNMSKETFDSLGHQKRVNYALLANGKEQFIREVTDGLAPPPYYFPKNVELNKNGYESFETVLERGAKPLSPDDFERTAEAHGALVLDTRKPEEFCASFVPRSISIGVDGDFAPWVGTLITDIKQPLLLVCPTGREEEVVTRLARVGYENVLGYLDGGVAAWASAGKETDSMRSVTAETFAEAFSKSPLPLFDVRRPGEYEAEHLTEARHVSLAEINDKMSEFHQTGDQYIHCAGGYRSVIAASILKARGIHNVVNILGGYKALAQTDLQRTDYTCTKSKI